MPGESKSLQANPGKALLTVQALRAVAAVMVVFHHSMNMVVERLSHTIQGYAGFALGLDLFFIISGLVMVLSSSSLKGPAGAQSFFVRRLERIIPLYWLTTTAKIGMLLLLPALALRAHFSWRQAVASFLFLPPGGQYGMTPVLVVGWSLSFEMFFYVLFAAAIVSRVAPVRFLVPAIALIVAASVVLHGRGPAILLLLNPIVLEFLYGVLLGTAIKAKRLPGIGLSWALLVGGFVLLMASANRMDSFARPIACGLPALAIVAGAVGLEGSLRGKLPRWLLALGDSSYSLYLTHGLVMPLVAVVAVKLSPPGLLAHSVVVVFATLTCVAAGEVCYRWVELPMIRYFQGRRVRATPVVA